MTTTSANDADAAPDDEVAGAEVPGSTATIALIAAEAGVSIPTVSKVLNGRTDVAAVTRARVEEVIDRHQYRRRRGRAQTGPGLLDLVFHELDAGWSVQIIKGVESVAGPERLGVVLSELGGAHRPRQEWLDDVLARRPRGVILVLSDLDPAQRRQLETRSIPFVVVDTAGEQPAGVPTVGSANWAGGLAATRHLLGLGHRKIAVVSGPVDVLCSRARIDGYRTALDEAGVAVDPGLVRYGDFFVGGGYTHGMDLLDRPDRPDRDLRRLRLPGPRRAPRRPRAGPAGARRTSPSSATTTCPSPSGSAPRSPPSTSPSTRWPPPPPAWCSAWPAARRRPTRASSWAPSW